MLCLKCRKPASWGSPQSMTMKLVCQNPALFIPRVKYPADPCYMLTLEFAQLTYGQVTFSLIKHPLKQRADSLGKTLMLGKIEGRRRKG